MSGGSWDYVCYKISEAADELVRCGDPLRAALGKHMQQLAEVMHDIEWADSGDSSPDYAVASIERFLAHLSPPGNAEETRTS
jgi:hypothetical protein